jgi:hypothetical protein
MKSDWKLPGSCMESARKLRGSCLESAWKLPESCLEAAGRSQRPPQARGARRGRSGEPDAAAPPRRRRQAGHCRPPSTVRFNPGLTGLTRPAAQGAESDLRIKSRITPCRRFLTAEASQILPNAGMRRFFSFLTNCICSCPSQLIESQAMASY